MRILSRLAIILLVYTVTCLAIPNAFAQVAAYRPVAATTRFVAPKGQANPHVEPQSPYTSVAELSKSEHLRRAAEHLKAAGETDLAKQITKELLIEAKLEQIRQLQAEVDQLRAGANVAQVLTLRMKVVELQTTDMRELGLEIDPAGGNTLLRADAFEAMIEGLRSKALAKVLAEPTLVTVSGRPASFHSGGEIPILVPQSTDNIAVEYRQTGTRVDAVGTVLKNGRVRLEICSTISEIDAHRSILLEDVSVPGLKTRKIDTAVEMDAGQTLVLCGLHQRESDGEGKDGGKEKSLLLAVTVQLEEPTATAVKEHPLGNGTLSERY